MDLEHILVALQKALNVMYVISYSANSLLRVNTSQ